MKIRSLTLTLFLLVIILATSQFTPTYESGPPAGVTGSPGDGNSCTACHGGAATNGNFITSDIPPTGYIPGAIYNVTATISHASFNKFGFQISPQTATGVQKGTLIVTDPVRTQLTGGTKYIMHKAAGTAGTANSNTWTFQWQAPATVGSGSLSLYGGFIKANGNGNSSGDAVFVSKLQVFEDLSNSLTENKTSTNEWTMYPMPCVDELNITLTTNQTQKVRVMIRSLDGKVVMENAYLNNEGTVKLNIAELPKGCYMVTVFEENRTLSKKLLKI